MIAIRTPCTEFGRTFTLGEIVSLPAEQEYAMFVSRLAEYAGSHNPQGILAPEGLVPITSVMFANPKDYGLDLFPRRTYVFQGFHFLWSGSSLATIGAGAEVTVTATPAEVQALNATPKLVLPAPQAGFAYIVNRIVIHKPAGTAYGGIAAGEDLVLKYTNAAGAQVSAAIETTGFLDQATAQTRAANGPGAIGAAAGDFPLVAAAPVLLHLTAGEITGGTAPLHVRVRFDLVQVAFTS